MEEVDESLPKSESKKQVKFSLKTSPIYQSLTVCRYSELTLTSYVNVCGSFFSVESMGRTKKGGRKSYCLVWIETLDPRLPNHWLHRGKPQSLRDGIAAILWVNEGLYHDVILSCLMSPLCRGID